MMGGSEAKVESLVLPVFVGKILCPGRVPGMLLAVPYYKITTWWSDGSKTESEEPAYDVPVIMPAPMY